jgi:hypothetical protein
MKKYIAFLVLSSLTLAAQGRGGGRPSSPPAGAVGGGQRPAMNSAATPAGRPAESGKPADAGQGQQTRSQTQQQLRNEQINSGSFKMLQEKTGMTSEQLQQLYTNSGARNYGQFVSAVLVSKNLGLDTTQVLDGLKTMSLGETLHSLGVAPDKAKAEIAKAKKQMKDAGK